MRMPDFFVARQDRADFLIGERFADADKMQMRFRARPRLERAAQARHVTKPSSMGFNSRGGPGSNTRCAEGEE